MIDPELQQFAVDLLRMVLYMLLCWALSRLETDEQP